MSEATLTASRKRKRVSSFEKETFVFEQDDDGEEVTITASKNWIKKFHKNHKEATIEAYKKELAREIVKKEYQCFSCKIFPRPGIKFLKKCKYCFKIFCHDCVTVKHVGCPRSFATKQDYEDIEMTLAINLDISKYMSYFCKNNKFGCNKNFDNEENLLQHEKCCKFQFVHCADIDCKRKVSFLNYFGHLNQYHGSYEDLGTGEFFKSSIDLCYLKTFGCSIDDCKPYFGTVTNYLKCKYCFKIFCGQGINPPNHPNSGERCSHHYCLFGLRVADQLFGKKLAPKIFTAFNEVFFEIGYIRNNLVHKWIYILALPDEAKNFYYNVHLQNENDENVLSYHSQVRSLVENPEEVIENENCFIFGMKTAKKFFKRGTSIVDYSLKIRNLKDEAKDQEEEYTFSYPSPLRIILSQDTKSEGKSTSITKMEDFLKYNEFQLSELGVLVQKRIYRRCKNLPLKNGAFLIVEPGNMVTFFKYQNLIAVKFKNNVFDPLIEPEHVYGIFNDYPKDQVISGVSHKNHLRKEN